MSEAIAEIPKHDITEVMFSPEDLVIKLPTRNELTFVSWMSLEYFCGTKLYDYMEKAKKYRDMFEEFRLEEGPDRPEFVLSLDPAKSALVKHGLESFLRHEHPEYPESVEVAKALTTLYPETYQSRLARLSVKAASEAVDYGTIQSKDLSVRASRLHISRTVLGEIELDNLRDMTVAEARTFSFSHAQTELRAFNGAVNGTKILPAQLISQTREYAFDSSADQVVTGMVPPEKVLQRPSEPSLVPPPPITLDRRPYLQDQYPTQPIDLTRIQVALKNESSAEQVGGANELFGAPVFKATEQADKRRLRLPWRKA